MADVASSNRRLFQAYQRWRNKSDDSNLTHLFSACEQSKLISKLIQLPLSPSEQDGLVDYLINVSHFKSAKLEAVLCLLLNGKLDEAQKYHKDFCLSSTSDDDDLFQSGMIISAIIESHVKNLPHHSSCKQTKSQEPVTPQNEK